MSNRRLRSLPRGRRSRISTLAAIVLAAVMVLIAVAMIQNLVGQNGTVLGSQSAFSRNLKSHTWHELGVLVTGIVCAVIGVILLLAGLIPARRPLLRLADPGDGTISGISRRSLGRDLRSVAVGVDGVTRAKVKIRKHRVKIKARSSIRDRTGLTDAITSAVQERIEALQPLVRLRVHARIVGKAS